ncbi:hypothetical protein BLSTO_04234 [Blastocystis sp. subtype 1]
MSITQMENLEYLELGHWCFAMENALYWPERQFTLEACPKVKQFIAYSHSMYDFYGFHLRNLPSLEEIYIEEECFGFASMSLTNMPQLQSITVGDNSFNEGALLTLSHLHNLRNLTFGRVAFQYCEYAIIEDLPELLSISLGNSALMMTLSTTPTLEMKDLPKLQSLRTVGSDSLTFHFAAYITANNIPSLTDIYLPLAFAFKRLVRVRSVPSFTTSPSDISPKLDQLFRLGYV